MRNSEHGLVIPFAALSFMAILGFIALVLDIGFARTVQRGGQSAVDAAALAGAAYLGQAQMSGGRPPSSFDTDFANDTIAMASANGIGPAEIQSVSCGVWDPTLKMFFACSSSAGAVCARCSDAIVDSVRIQAKPESKLFFSKSFVQGNLKIGLSSIASFHLDKPYKCIRPFGINRDLVQNLSAGDAFTVGNDVAGNWSKVDIDGNMSNPNKFQDAMIGSLCAQDVQVGSVISTAPGNAGIDRVFNAVLRAGAGAPMWVALTTAPSGGNDSVQILEFAKLAFLGDNGNSGSNWVGSFSVVERNSEPPKGGPTTVIRQLAN